MTVNVWTIDPSALDPSLSTNGNAFADALESEAPGSLNEIKDFFCLSQIRSQGLDARSGDADGEFRSSRRILLSEIPNMMRALGFYPSEYALDRMRREIEIAANRRTDDGDEPVEVSFDDVVRLYYNHRPYFPVSRSDVERAYGDLTAETAISWGDLETQLLARGERMTKTELAACLRALVGNASSVAPSMDAGTFITSVLGFVE